MIDGRIIKGIGGLYSVDTGVADGVISCGCRGIFRNMNLTPTIGDFVSITMTDENQQQGIIEHIKERRNFLLRPRVSNVDQAIIVFTLKKPSVPLDLLDKFILLAEDAKLEALICINKIDLVDEKIYMPIRKLYEKAGYNVVCTSVAGNIGIDELAGYLRGKVSVFSGPSGVGKSSVINLFLGKNKMETGELSAKISRGKHTTRHTELIQAKACGHDDNNSSHNTYIVDSPGFSSLNVEGISKESLAGLFKEFRPYLDNCRFNDCKHIDEPDCAVKSEVDKTIDLARYERYKTLYDELS